MRPPVETLIEKYRHNLYAAAFSACGNAQDAEDAVQETFVQYWSYKKEFESDEHVRAWLLRVAINQAKNLSSSFFRRKAVPLEEYMATLSFESESSSELFEAVMRLPAKYRTVMHLFYYEDYSVAEIAGILKLSQSNVKTRLCRARAELRRTLKEDWEDDE